MSVDSPPRLSASQALRARDWAELDRLYRHRESRGLPLDDRDRVIRALARLHLGAELADVQADLPDRASDEADRSLLLRHGVLPLREAGRFGPASELMARIDSPPESRVRDGLLLLSLLIQAGRLTEARTLADTLRAEFPADPTVAQAALRLLVKARQTDEALTLARQWTGRVDDLNWARLLLPLMSQSADATDRQWAEDVARAPADAAPEWLELAMQVHAHAGRREQVLALGEQALQAGHGSATLHRLMAQALESGPSAIADRSRTLAHWQTAHKQAPDNDAIATSLADTLMRLGRHEEALPLLARLVERKSPRLYANTLYARALRQSGRYDEAAAQYRLLTTEQPQSAKWPRYLAASLMQAGRRQEAAELFGGDLARRRTRLPGDFQQGLNALRDRIADTRLPQARLDWAWSLRAGDTSVSREEWTRRALWGHLADHYLLEWLECRPERAEQAMLKLANLDPSENILQTANPEGKPWILASAHVGPLYAGPLALALLGLPVRWLASTPGLLSGDYSRSLISTTVNSETEVVRQSLIALQQGQSLVVAVDGALNLAAPTVPFEGQHITYSPFCARLVHRMRLPSAFVAPKWLGEGIDFVVAPLPQPHDGESQADFAVRWQAAYLAQLAHYLRGAPENLRLSGGLWRQIR